MVLLVLIFWILKIGNPIERMEMKYSVKDYLINEKKYKLEEIYTIRSDYNYLRGLISLDYYNVDVIYKDEPYVTYIYYYDNLKKKVYLGAILEKKSTKNTYRFKHKE